MLSEKFILETIEAIMNVLLFNQKKTQLSLFEEKMLKKNLTHLLMVTFEDPLKKGERMFFEYQNDLKNPVKGKVYFNFDDTEKETHESDIEREFLERNTFIGSMKKVKEKK